MEHIICDKWTEIIEYMRDFYNINGVLYRTWIMPLSPISETDDSLIVAIDDERQGKSKSFIENTYRIQMQTSIEIITGKCVTITFAMKSELDNDNILSSGTKKNNDNNDHKSIEEEHPFLKIGHSFDNFVVSGSNSLAHAAAVAVAENPNGQIYNPLFLYSGPGLGKTHLMHSIGRYIIENHPEYKVMYITSEEFMNNVIEAIRNNKLKDDTAATVNLRNKYRNVDVLLIDDIQFIIGKESTQLEFFNTFEALFQAGKQLVISSDKPPSEMEQLDLRYRTRFNSGMPVDIQPPDYEICIAILRNKQEKSNIKLDEKILSYIATNIRTSIRDIEGAYNKVVLYSRLARQGEDVTLEMAEKALKDFLSPDGIKNITADDIIDMVCDHYNVDKSLLLSRKRSNYIVVPRQVCMYLCTEYTSLTQEQIAKKLYRDNHSTIVHGVKKIKDEITTNPELSADIDSIKKKLNIV